MPYKTIVIDREYASGGREIGKKLSEKLGVPLYDSALLIEASKRFGYSLDTIKSFDEKLGSRWLDYIINDSIFMTTDQTMVDPSFEVFQIMEKTITALSAEGPCIFMGRCADFILKKAGNVVSVFVYASDKSDKLKRAVNVDHIPESQANGYIMKTDKQRSKYFNLFTGQEWGNRANYDLCLNTSTLGYDLCAEVIGELYIRR